jgi:glutathione S-transferase
MHAGFSSLRSRIVFNLDVEFPGLGEKLMQEHPDVKADISRIFSMFDGALKESGGPFLFGDYSIGAFCSTLNVAREKLTQLTADAFYAPVIIGRLRPYHISVPQGACLDYVKRMESLPEVQQWIQNAKREKHFVAQNEPYRTSRL